MRELKELFSEDPVSRREIWGWIVFSSIVSQIVKETGVVTMIIGFFK